jgi:AcrR family transcriptional regulator
MAKQERALRTYEQTLDAAAAEIVRSGYSRTTLSAVVNRTGMTKGALYGHFSSKEALAAALVASARTACVQALTQVTEVAASAVDLLRLGLVGLLHRLDTDIRFRAALRIAVENGPEVTGADELLARIGTFIRGNATAAHDSGQLPCPCTTEAIINLLLAVVLGYERLLNAPGLALNSRELHDTQLFLDHLIRSVGAHAPVPGSVT